jgi:hypothetical protein
MKLKNYLLAALIPAIFIISATCFSQENYFSDYNDKKPGIFTASKGYLIVHTYAEQVYDDGITKSVYKPYKVYSETGKLINVNRSLEEPLTVKLQQGIYIVHAEMRSGIIEKFKVLIEGGKITEIEK